MYRGSSMESGSATSRKLRLRASARSSCSMALRAVFVISRGMVQDASSGTIDAHRIARASVCTEAPILFGGRRRLMHFRWQRLDHFEHAPFVVELHRHPISNRQPLEQLGAVESKKDRLLQIGHQHALARRKVQFG